MLLVTLMFYVMCYVVYHDYGAFGYSVIRCVKCVMIMVCHECGVQCIMTKIWCIMTHDYGVFDMVL